MSILRRKCDEFPNKTPILFELQDLKDSSYFEIKKNRYDHSYAVLSEKLDLSKPEVNWTERSWNGKGKIRNFGIISDQFGVIAIAIRDSITNKMDIYCRSGYFEDNPSHKRYINNFAKANLMSVRKDIHYVDQSLINDWIKPFEVGLEFYDEENQDKVTEDLFDKLKSKIQIHLTNQVPMEV